MKQYKHFGHSHFGLSRQGINSLSHREKVKRKRAERAFIAPPYVYCHGDIYINKGWGNQK